VTSDDAHDDIASHAIERLEEHGPEPGGQFEEPMEMLAIDIPDGFDVDVQEIRHRLGLSQTEFADAYGFSVHTLRKWEQWVRRPEKPTRLLLLMIRDMPEVVHRYLHWLSERGPS
jgi:DNA-binding XRE family transcriptional regulator